MGGGRQEGGGEGETLNAENLHVFGQARAISREGNEWGIGGGGVGGHMALDGMEPGKGQLNSGSYKCEVGCGQRAGQGRRRGSPPRVAASVALTPLAMRGRAGVHVVLVGCQCLWRQETNDSILKSGSFSGNLVVQLLGVVIKCQI